MAKNHLCSKDSLSADPSLFARPDKCQSIAETYDNKGIGSSSSSSSIIAGCKASPSSVMCDRKLSNCEANSQKNVLGESNCEVEEDCGSVVGSVVVNKVIAAVFEISRENAGGLASSAHGSVSHLENKVLASSLSQFLPPPSWKNVGTGEAVFNGAKVCASLEVSVTVADSPPSPFAMFLTNPVSKVPYGRPG